MPFEYRKLIGRIIEKYGTRREFAKALGISTVSLGKKLKCQTEFSQNDILRWSELLDIKPNEFTAYFFN